MSNNTEAESASAKHAVVPSPALHESHETLKPTNGLKGLQHWKHDLLAGVVVSLVSLPLSSGIAIASGAPPIYGLISSIIAGLIYPLLGGSYLTISGPAAGLAPALVATMSALGGAGDAHQVGAGYPKLLVVISIVGVAQILLGRLKLAKYAAVFPAAVVEGMLGAIGVLIFVKAIPFLLGVVDPGHPHGFLDYLAHIPRWVKQGIQPAMIVGAVTTALLLILNTKSLRRFKVLRVVPAHLWGVAVAVPLGFFVGLKEIDPALLIAVPQNPLSGIQLPDFSAILSDSSTWAAAGVGVVTLLLIDGVESIATAQAVDRLDPFKRTSDPDRVLLAMGVSNLVSSLLGGLTVIPGGVKSKTNIEAGGRTLWSNLVNALMLLLFLFVAPRLISMIPTAALGGILIYTGWKMAHPSIARHLKQVGVEQFVLYTATLVVTLLTDLLIGVAVGTLLKLILVLCLERSSTGSIPLKDSLKRMFRDPVEGSFVEGAHATITIGGPLVCFNAFHLRKHLMAMSPKVQSVSILVSELATVIDHTACESLMGAQRYLPHASLTIGGLETMKRCGASFDSLHLQHAETSRQAA